MQVLITISPLAWVAWPPRSPSTVKPSSRTRTIGSGMLHQSLRHHLSLADGHDHPPAQAPAGKRRVLAATAEGRWINRPLGIRVDQDPLVLARLIDDLARPRHACSVDDRISKAEAEDDADRRLEAMKAVRASLLGRQLVGRMVGRDHIDNALDQRVAQCLAVVGRAQWWIDIPGRTDRLRLAGGQSEVMGRSLRRHPQPICLSAA